MIDLVKLKLLAGDGGHGRVSLHREKYRPKGGPDGGHGGQGGNIIIEGNRNLNTLKEYAGAKEFKAEDGQMGGKNKKTGRTGQDIVLKVPLGTVVWMTAENEASRYRRQKYARPVWDKIEDESEPLVELKQEAEEQEPAVEPEEEEGTRFRMDTTLDKQEVVHEKYQFEQEGERVPFRPEDQAQPLNWDKIPEVDEVKQFTTQDKVHDAGELSRSGFKGLKLVEITDHGQQVVVCQGGFGGRGNEAFKSSTHQTPLEAEYGTFGERKEIILELRLLADVGLVGFPNAGKSTLLSKLTKATPKIANYPFTTLEPNLGVMSDENSAQDLVLADIPGLIEGASQGKGLGDRFLRHIENCQALMYMLFLPETVVYNEELTTKEKAEQVFEQYQQLKAELEAHHEDLLAKDNLLTLNKIDIYNKNIIEELVNLFNENDLRILPFSAITGEGLQQVKKEIFALTKKQAS
jgi:GTP-binding protein